MEKISWGDTGKGSCTKRSVHSTKLRVYAVKKTYGGQHNFTRSRVPPLVSQHGQSSLLNM